MDYYVKHLAKLGNAHDVILSENIVNDTGAIVASSGTQLTEELAAKIARHRLVKRLELQVSMKDLITPTQIVHYLIHDRRHKEIKDLLGKRVLVEIFEREASKLSNFSLILQKLTVLRQQLPSIFDNAVIGAYVSLLIAYEMKLDATQLHEVFLASLTRDLGYLHINPDFIDSKELLTQEQWQNLQGHVVISYQFLTIVPGISKGVQRAVMEHHERTDGLGYPRQLLTDNVCLSGQIVAFSDMTIGLFNRYIGSGQYRLIALESVLQLNTGIHTRRVTQAAIRIINRLFLKDSNRLSEVDITQRLPALLRHLSYVRNWFLLAKETNRMFQAQIPQEVEARSTEFLTRIESVLITSGITDDLFMQWLKELDPNSLSSEEYLDIEHFALMVNEASFQFKKALLTTSSIYKSSNANMSTESKEELIKRIGLLRELLARFHADTV